MTTNFLTTDSSIVVCMKLDDVFDRDNTVHHVPDKFFDVTLSGVVDDWMNEMAIHPTQIVMYYHWSDSLPVESMRSLLLSFTNKNEAMLFKLVWG